MRPKESLSMYVVYRGTGASRSVVYNRGAMQQSSVGSFAKFTIGFLLFISLSLGVTLAVSYITTQQDQTKQTAAAFQALLQQGQ